MEYIVIDGASTDGTQDRVRSYGTQIDCFVSEPDNGIADAFNKGIARASGDIIGIINSDDELLPGAVIKVLDFFASHPDALVMHADMYLYTGGRFVKRVTPATRWWFPWRLVILNHPATFVRKQVYLRYGLFSTNYRIAMDVEMFFRWKRADVAIAYFHETLARMAMGGLSDTSAYIGYREVRDILVEKGYPVIVVYLHYYSRFLVHRLGKLHANLLARLRD